MLTAIIIVLVAGIVSGLAAGSLWAAMRVRDAEQRAYDLEFARIIGRLEPPADRD